MRGLVLCDPVHVAARAQVGELDFTAELWYQAFHNLPLSAQLVGYNRSTVEIYLRHFYTYWWGDGSVEERHFQAIVDAYAAAGAFEASLGWYRARSGVRETLAPTGLITTPTRILWGMRDPITPVALAESLNQSFADFQLTRVPGVGHFAPLEAPDDVAGAVLQLATDLSILLRRS